MYASNERNWVHKIRRPRYREWDADNLTIITSTDDSILQHADTADCSRAWQRMCRWNWCSWTRRGRHSGPSTQLTQTAWLSRHVLQCHCLPHRSSTMKPKQHCNNWLTTLSAYLSMQNFEVGKQGFTGIWPFQTSKNHVKMVSILINILGTLAFPY